MYRNIKNIDLILLLAVIAVVIFGILMIYSASYKGSQISTEVRRQIIFLIIGLISMSIMMSTDYEFWGKCSLYLYICTIAILIFVLLKGDVIRGAQSWITLGPLGRFQPSELAKITLIITLSQCISLNEKYLSKVSSIIKILFHIGLPMILILIQPDLGTSLVLIAITFTMLFWIGVNPVYLISVLIIGLGLTPFILKEYQMKRLTIFLNPENDPTGDGWNILQSITAIGSGRIIGKGFLSGTQSHLQFVPENSTDFIFSVIGEEFGFIGSIILIATYFLIIWRILNIAKNANDTSGSLMALGVTAMFMFHILENIGMNMGIMPITGIPLPFISVGGSSLITNFMAIGLVLNIKLKSQKTLF